MPKQFSPQFSEKKTRVNSLPCSLCLKIKQFYTSKEFQIFDYRTLLGSYYKHKKTAIRFVPSVIF